ncbi:putative ribonuclease H-like domain-containing protein [Tanacetum coccineum]
MVPRAVLMKSSLVSVNTARQVNAAHSKTTMNAARPMSYLSKIAHSTVKRPIHKNTTFKNSNINQRVNTARDKKFNTARLKAVVNVIKGNNFIVVKASACWVWKPKHKVLDHVSKHNSSSIILKKFDYVDAQGKSKFTWVFFLATKDETSGILKSFITGIENLEDHKVKVIRCDNGTEFKNKEMNQFCGIKDHSGKFDGKADEGFFVGYSLNSEAFRVFNSRTRIVEENLHIRFSESTPNVVGTKASDNAGQARKETKPVKNYILLPLWTADPPFSQDPKSFHDDGSKPSSDDEKKVDEVPRKESECNDQEKEDNVNSTNTVNAAGTKEVNAIGGKTSIELLFDPNMPSLEDYSIFDCSRDDEDNGEEADMNNLDTTIQVSLIPTTRIHKDHPLEEVIGDLQSATQTRKMLKNLKEHGFVRFEDPDFLDRVYKVEKALYGLHQAPRAWYETLSTYLLDNGFQRGKIDKTLFIKRHKGDILLLQIYVDDVIFGSTKKELCNAFKKLMHKKFQMSSMGELTFFLGLQVQQKKDGIFISQDKYVVEVLKKFRFTEVKTASTPMETQKPLLKDEDGEEVDVHMYRLMISSLMYLTSSRPDIMFAICACARYQVNPKVSHLHAVKRIFSDYAGASLGRKSTTGGCQFFGCRLISWQCKKQTVVANSTTKAEYVVASSCCG